MGAGHKVGRVEQAETALGAEMRLAAEKGKGAKGKGKAADKIVRRYGVFLSDMGYRLTIPIQRTEQSVHKWHFGRPCVADR